VPRDQVTILKKHSTLYDAGIPIIIFALLVVSTVPSAAIPSIDIETPGWVSYFGPHVIVRGRVREEGDSYESLAPTEIDSLWWEILDTNHRSRIRYEPDGSFEFAIPTLGLPRTAGGEAPSGCWD
jgi:hypothetical protein